LTLVLAACSPSADDTGPAEPGVRTAEEEPLGRALAGITAEHIRGHLDYLAADALEGRMTGSEGYERAASYVARQFEALGLRPGGEDGWYQPVPLRAARLDVDSAKVIVHRAGEDRELAWKQDFI